MADLFDWKTMVFDWENGGMDLDADRRAGSGLLDAELTLREYQVRLSREQLQTRIKQVQMWIDDDQSWTEEEQLRLDGVEAWLLGTLECVEEADEQLRPPGVKKSWVLDQLTRLEERQAAVDLEEARLKLAQSYLDRVQRSTISISPY